MTPSLRPSSGPRPLRAWQVWRRPAPSADPGGPRAGHPVRWVPLIAAAVAVVIVPHVFSRFELSPPGLAENRVLAECPETPRSLADLEALPGRVDEYVRDQFPPRAHLIGTTNYARYKLGYSTLDRVVVGKDGWLFYYDTHLARQLTGRHLLTPAEVDYWVAGFRQRTDWLAGRGARFYTLVAPRSPSVYPEKLPSWMPRAELTTVEQLLAGVTAAGIDRVVYPRKALVRAKADRTVYEPFDTHWTGHGAYVAYVELMTRLAQDDPTLAPLPQSAFTPITHPPVAGDKSVMLGIADRVKHDRVTYNPMPIHDPARTEYLGPRIEVLEPRFAWMAPQVIETDAPNERVLLLTRDSYSLELLPFLKPHFRRIVLTHLQDGGFRQDLIEKYNPDVVILEVIESGLHYMMPLLQLPG